MSNRSPVTTEDTAGAPAPLEPGSVVAGATPGYWRLAISALSGVSAFGASLVAAVDAAAAKALLALTKSDVGLGNVDNTSDVNKPVSTAQATADGLRVLKTGDTMTGGLTLSNGANLTISGANALGEGNIVMTGVPSGAFDTNLLLCDATSKTMGMICGSTAAFGGTYGPYCALRGNTYALAAQRGNFYLAAGKPTAPAAGEGLVAIYTNNVERLQITSAGAVQVATSLAIGSGTALTKAVVYTPTLAPADVSATDEYNEQYFTVTGLSTSDTVFVNPPAMSGAPHSQLIAFRVSAANTLALTFRAVSGTHSPPQGVYRVVAIRS
jgi:hypothetical protein